MDINQSIPEKWRLEQFYLKTKTPIPNQFPVFIKPEWGQNANGIVLIRDLQSYKNLLQKPQKKHRIQRIVQYATTERKEYEIFFVRDSEKESAFSVFKIVQVKPDSNKAYPINSIKNNNIKYIDCTDLFDDLEQSKIQKHLLQLANYRMARVGLKTNSKKDLIAGQFHIIEINLFAPLPLNIMDENISPKVHSQFIKLCTQQLVKVSALVAKENFCRFVFFKTIIKHYQTRLF